MSTRPHVEGEHPGWCRLGPSCAPSSERRPVEHCGSDFVLRPEHDDVRAEVTVRHDEDVLRGVDHGRTVVVLDLENEAFIGARADTRRERAAAARGVGVLIDCGISARCTSESRIGATVLSDTPTRSACCRFDRCGSALSDFAMSSRFCAWVSGQPNSPRAVSAGTPETSCSSPASTGSIR